jgi:hypothetical protein
MKRWTILISLLLVGILWLPPGILLPASAGAGEVIIVPLMYPRQFNAPKQRSRVKTKGFEISGEVAISIDRAPSLRDIEQERYLVEYFIDNTLSFKTKGYLDPLTGEPSFTWRFNTSQYKRGKHKIIVNFWDNKGPSAIGVEHIIILPARTDGGEKQ